MSVEFGATFWFRNVTLDDLSLDCDAWRFEMQGDIDGVFV